MVKQEKIWYKFIIKERLLAATKTCNYVWIIVVIEQTNAGRNLQWSLWLTNLSGYAIAYYCYEYIVFSMLASPTWPLIHYILDRRYRIGTIGKRLIASVLE